MSSLLHYQLSNHEIKIIVVAHIQARCLLGWQHRVTGQYVGY